MRLNSWLMERRKGSWPSDCLVRTNISSSSSSQVSAHHLIEASVCLEMTVPCRLIHHFSVSLSLVNGTEISRRLSVKIKRTLEVVLALAVEERVISWS